MIKLPFDVQLDLLAGGQVLHFDQDLVEVVRIKLESRRRYHLDVQVLALDPAKDLVDQLVEDGFWRSRRVSVFKLSYIMYFFFKNG